MRTPVESSNLAAVSWDDPNAFDTVSSDVGIMDVEFKNGTVYRYMDVPKAVMLGLLASNSKGRFFNEHVKNSFMFVKLEDAA